MADCAVRSFGRGGLAVARGGGNGVHVVQLPAGKRTRGERTVHHQVTMRDQV